MATKKYFTILSCNGVDAITVFFNDDTELYHYNGDANYCGYTLNECIEREAML